MVDPRQNIDDPGESSKQLRVQYEELLSQFASFTEKVTKDENYIREYKSTAEQLILESDNIILQARDAVESNKTPRGLPITSDLFQWLLGISIKEDRSALLSRDFVGNARDLLSYKISHQIPNSHPFYSGRELEYNLIENKHSFRVFYRPKFNEHIQQVIKGKDFQFSKDQEMAEKDLWKFVSDISAWIHGFK